MYKNRDQSIKFIHRNETYPSFSSTGSAASTSLSPMLEIISRNCLTASMCSSVLNMRYSWPVYSSLHGCADRELTRLPRYWIVLEISVKVRLVWWSCGVKGVFQLIFSHSVHPLRCYTVKFQYPHSHNLIRVCRYKSRFRKESVTYARSHQQQSSSLQSQ